MWRLCYYSKKWTNLRLVERYFCLAIQTTFRTKNLFHYTTVISFKKSRFGPSIVPCFRSRKHEFSWLQSRISSWKGRPSSPCRWLTYSRNGPLQTEKHLWWFGGTVCAAETNKLSLQIQWYDSAFSKTSFCFEFDYKWSHGFYLWQPLSSRNRVE